MGLCQAIGHPTTFMRCMVNRVRGSSGGEGGKVWGAFGFSGRVEQVGQRLQRPGGLWLLFSPMSSFLLQVGLAPGKGYGVTTVL
jgi:hypothetical protein